MPSDISLFDIFRAVAVDDSSIELLTGDGESAISDVRLVENLQHLGITRPGTFAVLDHQLSQLATTYQFDVAVRRAISVDLSGFGLLLPRGENVSITALALARKSGLAIARIDPTIDPSDFIAEMARRLANDLYADFQRALRTTERLDRWGIIAGDPVRIADVATETLGRKVSVTSGERPDIDQYVSVGAFVNSTDGPWLAVERSGSTDKDAFVDLVLWRIAAQAGRDVADEHIRERSHRMRTAEVLLRLMDTDRSGGAALASTAKRLGIDPNGWHSVVRFELDNLLDVAADEVTSYALRESIAGTTLEVARSFSESTFVAHEPSMVVLLWTDRDPPAPDDGLVLHRRANTVLERLLASRPSLRVYCGVGGRQAGLQGLAASATDARMAISTARATDRVNLPASYDATGLRSALLEWYSSASVRESVGAILEPLDRLPARRRDPLLITLSTFLDQHGSVTGTAKSLHLHRNAVRYRIKRVFEILDIDAEDVDQRLFLHLACRVRLSN